MNDRTFRLIKSGTHQQMVCFHHAGGTYALEKWYCR